MARSLVILLALLALSGCDWDSSDQRAGTSTAPSDDISSPQPAKQSPTQRLIDAIEACEVRRIVFAEDRTYVSFRAGRTLQTRRLDDGRVTRAAYAHANACNIVIAVE
jgi:hypothetical protein